MISCVGTSTLTQTIWRCVHFVLLLQKYLLHKAGPYFRKDKKSPRVEAVYPDDWRQDDSHITDAGPQMLNAGERTTAVCQLRTGGALKAALTCTCFASISLFVLASQVCVEEQTEGEKPQRSNSEQTRFWKLGSWGVRRGRGNTAEAWRSRNAVCSCLLCGVRPCPPAALGGDLGKPSPPS